MTAKNTDLIVAWVEALESGGYQQTDGYLHTETGYCCLGVLCDVAVKQGVVKGEWAKTDRKHEHNDATVYEFIFEGIVGEQEYPFNRHHDMTLPSPLTALVGLDSTTGGLAEDDWRFADGLAETLAEANDDYVKFREIAEAIRKELLPAKS